MLEEGKILVLLQDAVGKVNHLGPLNQPTQTLHKPLMHGIAGNIIISVCGCRKLDNKCVRDTTLNGNGPYQHELYKQRTTILDGACVSFRNK